MRPFSVRRFLLSRGRQPRLLSAVLAVSLVGFVVPTFVPSPTPAQAANQLQVRLGPNGAVDDLTAPDANGVRYMAGKFTAFDAVDTGNAALVDGTTAAVDMTMPKIVGTTVKTIISDGSGGYYIGGTFTTVGGVARRNAAHINADGTVDANWNPSPNLEVKTLLLVGSTVYMGGLFSQVGGLTRNFLASVTTSGAMTTWAPQVSGSGAYVNAMIEIGGIIYFVGRFTTVEGSSRTGAAALNSTGTLQNWNPSLDVWAWAIVTDGTTIYLGGAFGSAGGSNTRKGLAAFDTTGNLLTWNPNTTAVSGVNALALSGSDIYVGGTFTSIGGSSRKNLAAFSTSGTGTLRTWAPTTSGEVFSLAISGSTIYVSGIFSVVNTSTRLGFAALDTSGVVQSWNVNASSSIGYALLVSGSNIFVGGNLQYAGGITRNGLAAIGTNNALTNWAPAASSYVYSVVLSGNILYVGGSFTFIDGVARNRLAAIDTSGTLLSWNPNANDEVFGMELSGTTMYVGGRFTTVAGVSRTQIAALDVTATATALSSFNVTMTGTWVQSIRLANGIVYFGGEFTAVGASTRNYAAAVDTSGVLQTWNPNLSGGVYAVAESNGIIYLGGTFTTVGGVARGGAAAIDTSGVLQSWNPATSTVYAIAVNGTHVVIGGTFTSVKSTARKAIAVVETDGTLLAVNPNLTNTRGTPQVNAIVAEANAAYFVGDFTNVGSLALPCTGALNYDSTLNQWSVTVSATTTTTLAPNAQTITFASLSDRVYGVAPFSVSATATSGLTVTFSSTTPLICTVATTTVTILNVGTCTVQADQAGQVGATTWLAAPSVTQSFTVTTKPLTMTGAVGIPRDYNGSSTATVNFSAAQLSGIVGSDNVGFSTSAYAAIFSSPAAGASKAISVSGVTLTGTEASRYTLTQPTVSASINGAPVTITAATISVPYGTTFSSSFTNTTLVGSDAIGQMVYTYAGTGGTSYTASTTKPTAVGTYSITPSSAGFTTGAASNYLLSYTASTLTISAQSSTITFASLADRIYGIAPITLSATASSGLSVSFSSTTPSVCTVSSTTLTVINIGVCTVEASQSGNSNYLAASTVSRSFTIATKQISLTGIAGVDKNYDATLTASVNYGSAQLSGVEAGDTVTFSTTNASAAFVTTSAGVGKTIAINGIVLTGTHASRYVLSTPSATATINTVAASISLNPTSMYAGSPLVHTYSSSGFAGSDAISSMTYTYQGTGSTNYNASTTAPNVIGTYSVTPSAVVLSSGASSSYVITYSGSTLTIMAPTTTTTVPVDDGESAVGGNVSLNQSPGIVNVTTTFGFLLTDAGALVPQIKMRLYIGPINLKLSSTYKVAGKKKTYKCTYKTFGSTTKRPQVWTTYSPKSKCTIPAVLLTEVRAGRAVIKATGKITRFWSLNKSPKRPDGSKINSRLINVTIKN